MLYEFPFPLASFPASDGCMGGGRRPGAGRLADTQGWVGMEANKRQRFGIGEGIGTVLGFLDRYCIDLVGGTWVEMGAHFA